MWVMRICLTKDLIKKRPVLVAKNGPKNQESLPQNSLGQFDFRNKEFSSSTSIKHFLKLHLYCVFKMLRFSGLSYAQFIKKVIHRFE